MTNRGTEIAARVREAATQSGLTVNGLANETGIPYKTLWRRLNHTPDHFLVGELVTIARITGTDWAWLVTGTPAPVRAETAA